MSTHELNQPGCYRDVKDTTCTAQFLILDPKPEMAEFGDPYFLAWTTTPWTLPSNTALCVGPNITYVAVQTYNPYTGMPMTAVLMAVKKAMPVTAVLKAVKKSRPDNITDLLSIPPALGDSDLWTSKKKRLPYIFLKCSA